MDPWEISLCAQLSCALEVTCPKPGNVSRYHDFQDTTLEHFIASAVAVGKSMRKAAEAGFNYPTEEEYRYIGIGRLILEAVSESQNWHTGRNTNLGITSLLVPLCASYGSAVSVYGSSGLSDEMVRETLHSIMKNTTVEDAINFYRAVRKARPGGLGKQRILDVNDPKSEDKIIEKGLNLYSVLMISTYDSIPKELTEKMWITFEVGSPAIIKEYKRRGSLREGILYGYMKILSEVPDSLIARKRGLDVARDVSKKAKEILEMGLPQKELNAFDEMLRSKDNALNPGTTADLTTSSLMVALLKGVRP